MSKRLTALVLAATLGLAGLSGCTSHVTTCTSTGCDVSLKGKDASTKIGANDAVEIKLVSAEKGGTTRFTLGKAGELTCEQGAVKEFNDAKVTCKEVGDNSLKLRIDYTK